MFSILVGQKRPRNSNMFWQSVGPVLSCQGLMNRNTSHQEEAWTETAVYTIKESWDQEWLDTSVEYDTSWTTFDLSIEAFLSDICAKQNFPKILYSKSIHHETIPQIITVAGALSGVPLDIDTDMDEIISWIDHPVIFDANTEFLGFTELEATRYIFEHFAYITKGV